MATDAFSFPAHPNPKGTLPRVARRTNLPWPVSTLVLWQDRARMRGQLRDLTPELLRDMGLTPEMIAPECAKPCWMA